MMNRILCQILVALALPLLATSQEKLPAKGQAPKVEDFAVGLTEGGDTSVPAVVLFSIGKLAYEGNTKGWLSHATQVRRRLKILQPSGTQYANMSIELRHNPGDFDGANVFEELSQVSGYSWNLENGVVKESKMDKSAIITDKTDKREDVVRFSLPNVKPGSIIEINYTLTSPFVSLVRPWFFQETIPVRYSVFDAELPTHYVYKLLQRGRHPFIENKSSTGYVTYNIAGVGNNGSVDNMALNTGSYKYHLAAKDLPAIFSEDYVSAFRNHALAVYFQIAQTNWNGHVKSYHSTWSSTAESMYNHSQFGAATRTNVAFYHDVVAEAKASATTDREKAQWLYHYVQTNFACTDFRALYAERPLRQVWLSKSGSVAELNLLLSSMLEAAGLNAHPTIAATRSYGKPFTETPILQQYDYVVAAVQLDGRWTLLDAAQKNYPFGQLPAYLYNGAVQVLFNGSAQSLEVDPDSVSEPRMSMAFIGFTPKGDLQADYQVTLGPLESGMERGELAGESEEQTTKRLQRNLSRADMTVSALKLQGRNELSTPLSMSYTLTQQGVAEDNLLIFNPIVGEGFKANPFKSPQRGYPVEMNYPLQYTYNANIELPAGYQVEELPKNVRLDYNGGEGFFDYTLLKGANGLKFRYRLHMKKAVFAPEEYEQLRSFFSEVVKKQQEMIVLKKQGV